MKRQTATSIIQELTARPFVRWAAATPEAQAKPRAKMSEAYRDPASRAWNLERLKRYLVMKK